MRRYPGWVCSARVAGDASGAQAPTSYGPLGAFLTGAANEETPHYFGWLIPHTKEQAYRYFDVQAISSDLRLMSI